MNEGSEELFGELEVSSTLRLGSENLRLLFTNRRLIVDHVGKRGRGAVVGTSILGKISGTFEDLFQSGKESASRRRIERMSPAQVLRARRDNFAIGFDEVVSVLLEQTVERNLIMILTRDDKFEFLTRTRFDAILGLFERTLGAKTTARRLSPLG